MKPGETISELGSAPAPYLALAPAPKQVFDTALHRGPDPTSPRRGRHLTEGRTVSQRDNRSTSRACGADISLAVRVTHPTELARLSFLPYRSLAGLPNTGVRPPSQGAPALQPWTLRQAHPREPPIRVADLNCNLVGSAQPSWR